MKHLLSLLLGWSILLAGCLTTPVSQSGSIGSATVTNSNPDAIIAAALNVFPKYGYSPGVGNYPSSISFDKKSDQFAKIMWGSYGVPQSIRVKVKIIPIPGTHDFRIVPKVYTVSNAGEAGFESDRPLVGLWNSEFGPLLKETAAQASGAGPR